jgi:hypothetical protein
MTTVRQCADEVVRASNELPLCAVPSAKHSALLASYLLSLKRGEAGVCNMIVADYRRFMDLGALERAADLLLVLKLFLASCRDVEFVT